MVARQFRSVGGTVAAPVTRMVTTWATAWRSCLAALLAGVLASACGDAPAPAPPADRPATIGSAVALAAPPREALRLPLEANSVRFAVIGDSGRGDLAQYEVSARMQSFRKIFP